MADSAAFAGGMGMGWRWVVVAWCAWGRNRLVAHVQGDIGRLWRSLWGVLRGREFGV